MLYLSLSQSWTSPHVLPERARPAQRTEMKGLQVARQCSVAAATAVQVVSSALDQLVDFAVATG